MLFFNQNPNPTVKERRFSAAFARRNKLGFNPP